MCPSQECIGVRFGLRGDGDADADRHHQLSTAHLDGIAQGVGHACGDKVRLGGSGLNAHHHERVPAEAGHGVRRADRVLQPMCHLDQKLVADRLSVCVVDVLEAIEVEEQDRHRTTSSGGRVKSLRQPVVQQCPVRQPGQRVVQRLPRQPVLEFAAVGHVMRDDRGRLHRAGFADDG